MLTMPNPRKPAPILARGPIGLRLCIRPNAFGNALGQSLAKFALQPDQDVGTAPISKLQAERAQYGGLSLKQVLGGERNYLDALSAYNGDNTSKQASGSWDETVAAWRADNPRYQVLPQVEIFGKSETAEYQLNAAFGLNKKVTFSDTNLPRIEAQQSIWSSYANIAGAYWNGKLGLGDATTMAWSNTKFAYQGSQRTQGSIQVLNGVLEGAGAIAISGTGVGAVLGVPLAVHGGDSIDTGLVRLWTGEMQNTATYIGVKGLTGSHNAAMLVNDGIPFVGGVAGISAFASVGNTEIIATAQAGRLTQLLPESSLSARQALTHAELSEQGAFATFSKRQVSMSDLRDIGRVTGDEYNMFTKGGERLVIRGEGSNIRVSEQMYNDLLSGAYGKFSGHTHPLGYSIEPGPADRPFLSQMQQSRSAIWGDSGYRIFGPVGPADDARILSEINRAKMQKIHGN